MTKGKRKRVKTTKGAGAACFQPTKLSDKQLGVLFKMISKTLEPERLKSEFRACFFEKV